MKLAVALTALLAAAAHAEPTPKLSEEDRQFLDRVNLPVLLTLPGMDAVRIEKDVVYQKRGGQQKADVYLPPKGMPSGVVNHPDAEHGFDNKLDAPRTREVLRQMLAFLHEHLD